MASGPCWTAQNLTMKYHVLGDKGKKMPLRIEIDEAVFFSLLFAFFSWVLLFTIACIFAISSFLLLLGISMHSVLIVPSITFIESFWFLDWNKSLSNQSIRAVSIPNYLCEWWFSFASTKLPQVMNMSTWFVFIQWIDNNMSCLRH